MKHFAQRFILSAVLMGNEAVAASLYGGLEGGTSFSPTGVGVYLGATYMSAGMEVGYGIFAKNQKTGNPNSLTLLWSITERWTVFGSLTRYSGTGTRTVVYANGLENNELKAKWDLIYRSFGARYSISEIRRTLPFLNVYFGAGISAYHSGKISVEDDSDATNLDTPVGIRVEDIAYTYGAMGPGDWGPFALVGVSYEFL